MRVPAAILFLALTATVGLLPGIARSAALTGIGTLGHTTATTDDCSGGARNGDLLVMAGVALRR